MAAGNHIDTILFDIGGVLVEMGDSPVPLGLLPDDSDYGLADWHASEAALAFEKGLASPQVFAETLRAETRCSGSIEDIIAHFTAWPRGPFPGVTELLAQLRARHRLALLTNTNALHWARCVEEFKLPRLFDHVFASHQLALIKPEPEIFAHVVHTLAVAPEQILFLDDSAANVDAARAQGIRSERVQGFDQVVQTLVAHGIIEA